ncbi:MAG: hypothetical protein DI543_06895 [Bradyrhizobium icense]|nr:MAG: hypothetical protein DI543_06895 [Bradyrhizobium icense]
MAETPDKKPQEDRPEAEAEVSPNRLTATVVSLVALGIIGAATANFLPPLSLPNIQITLPKFERLSLPKFDVALPKLDRFPWPNFHRTPQPAPVRVAAPAPPPAVTVPIPDPIVRAALRDIQNTQQQHTDSLSTLFQGAETQQADLRRVSRQLSALTAQVNALHGAMGPLTTGSIPPSKMRIRAARKPAREPVASVPPMPSMPSAVGPVSVGGAPLGTTPDESGRATTNRSRT